VRRAAAALLGTLAGTALIVGMRYATAQPDAKPPETPAVDGTGAGRADENAGEDTDEDAASGAAGAPAPTNPATWAPPAGSTAACTNVAGEASRIAAPGTGTVSVTIQVCARVLKTASAAQSRSNWEANAAALPALNALAVKNYKTDFAAIHYSGATLTSRAYQASLRSATARAGI
jgi:uncharacterized protein with FMN-binding domain